MTWTIMPPDAAAVTEHLDLRDAVHIGHSTGGGEVTRYVARHGKSRVAKAVLMSAVPPIMVKSPNNPDGLPISVFDDLRKSLAANRAQFYHDCSGFSDARMMGLPSGSDMRSCSRRGRRQKTAALDALVDEPREEAASPSGGPSSVEASTCSGVLPKTAAVPGRHRGVRLSAPSTR